MDRPKRNPKEGRSRMRFLLSLVVLCACSSGETETAGQLPQDPQDSSADRFSFESGTDEVSQALRELYRSLSTTTADPEVAAELHQNRRQALATLREDPDGAAEQLIADVLQRDPADENGLFDLYYLLGELDSAAGADFLRQSAAARLPTRDPVHAGQCVQGDPRFVAMRLRLAAVDQLGRIAAYGNGSAKTELLSLVQSGDLDLKRAAIQAYYESGEPRWKAKRVMGQLLAPEERYLLHEVF